VDYQLPGYINKEGNAMTSPFKITGHQNQMINDIQQQSAVDYQPIAIHIPLHTLLIFRICWDDRQ
jgi:hypothetical protein